MLINLSHRWGLWMRLSGFKYGKQMNISLLQRIATHKISSMGLPGQPVEEELPKCDTSSGQTHFLFPLQSCVMSLSKLHIRQQAERKSITVTVQRGACVVFTYLVHTDSLQNEDTCQTQVVQGP